MRYKAFYLMIIAALLIFQGSAYGQKWVMTEQMQKLLVEMSQPLKETVALLKEAVAIEKQARKDRDRLSKKLQVRQRHFERVKPGTTIRSMAKGQLKEAIAKDAYALRAARNAELEILAEVHAKFQELVSVIQKLRDDDPTSLYRDFLKYCEGFVQAIRQFRQRLAREIEFTEMVLLRVLGPDWKDWESSNSEAIISEGKGPATFTLNPNYPNPFNILTTIEYSIPEDSHVSLEIYNNMGQVVKTLVDAYQPAGVYRVRFDGADASGKELASGVYFFAIETENNKSVGRMMLLK